MTNEALSQPQNPAVAEYLAELADRTTAILGSDLVGVYAAGSLALGSYQQGRSDIDIAIVCAAPLDLQTKEDLVAALRHEALPCPARGLELVVYRREVAAAGTSDPGFEVELNTGSRMDFRATWAGDDRTEPDGTFWYAIDRSILAERGWSLVGPPAAEVFRSVPKSALIDLLIASLRWHLAQQLTVPVDEPAAWTSDAVLNACRAWRRVQTGHWTDKATAGQEVTHAAAGRLSGQAAVGRVGVPPVDHSAVDVEVVDVEVIEQALAARSAAAGPAVGRAQELQRIVLADLQRAAAGVS